MGIVERKEREKAELRQKIIDAARELFATRGYENVSMRQIAQAIEYSATAIYLHFEDKEELFREICREDFEALARAFVRMGAMPNPLHRIRSSGLAYGRFAQRHPNHYRLMFMTPMLPPKTEADYPPDDPARNAYAFLVQAVCDALAQGLLRPEFKDPHLVAQTFWAMVHGVASLQTTHSSMKAIPFPSYEKRLETALDGIMRGMTRNCTEGRS